MPSLSVFPHRLILAAAFAIAGSAAASSLSVDGVVESRHGGFVFPDGTIQTTAGGESSAVPGPAIGTLDIPYLGEPVPVHGIVLEWANAGFISLTPGPPEFVRLEVLVDAGNLSPAQFLAVATATNLGAATIDLGDVLLTMPDETFLVLHELASAPTGQATQLVRLGMQFSILDLGTTGLTVGWDRVTNLPRGDACDIGPRVYSVLYGESLPTPPVDGTAIGIDRFRVAMRNDLDVATLGGGGGSPSIELENPVIDFEGNHHEALCLFQYLLDRTGDFDTQTLTLQTLQATGDAKLEPAREWYELTGFLPVSWRLSSDRGGTLRYHARFQTQQVCHGARYDLEAPPVESCWDLTTSQVP